MISIFFHNMTMIIASMYIYTRFDNFVLRNTQKFAYNAWLTAMVSFLSIQNMLHPFKLDGMIFDLRDVPLLLGSYVLGWKVGVASILLPAVFRWYYIAGPTAWQGIIIGIIAPVIIGTIFNQRHQINPIKLKSFFIAFGTYFLVRLCLFKFLVPMKTSDLLLINLNHLLFGTISLICMILILNDFHKSKNLKNRLEFMSKHDSLTNLLNLHHFKEKVNVILKHQRPVAIAMLDIDYFKEYNDKHGHPAGDMVLEKFALLLKENTRQGDLVARYGGEEFIICFTNIGQQEHVLLSLERLRVVVQKHVFEGSETQPGGNVTVSIGFSYSSGEKSLDLLIQEADQALYKSKEKGRNLVSFYSNIC